VTGLDHDVAYRQLRSGALDVVDVYATDAKIDLFSLRVLEDDRRYFPRYDAVLLYRQDVAERFPQAVSSVLRLEGAISEADMAAANGRCELERWSERRVAGALLADKFQVVDDAQEDSTPQRLAKRTVEHLDLVRKSLIPAILLAIPLGIVSAKRARLGQLILAVVGIIQTIPALALLVMLITPVSYLRLTGVGAGSVTAVLALFLYSLLPIVRNTYAGLHGIEGAYAESALALGLPARFRLFRIELPLASRHILSGVKTAAVINVGFATLGALIGAGGYGQPILTGIRLADYQLILEGAVPAAVLALLVQGLFELAEIWCVPRGLRLTRGG
jgi:osmoprotectant transport system permease protein